MSIDLKRLYRCLKLDERECFRWLRGEMGRLGYDLHATAGYDYMVFVPRRDKGSLYCMVAHLDTIPRLQGVKLERNGVYVTNAKGVLGADDRAGVYAILELIERARQGQFALPIVVFTTGEESGGIGVRKLIKDRALDALMDRINLFIEIDRQGVNEFVYYSWELPEQIEDIAKRFGFVEAFGTYSDVADLTDCYYTPHINVSAGYFNQHSKREYLDISVLEMTIERLARMMREVPDVPYVLVREEPHYTEVRATMSVMTGGKGKSTGKSAGGKGVSRTLTSWVDQLAAEYHARGEDLPWYLREEDDDCFVGPVDEEDLTTGGPDDGADYRTDERTAQDYYDPFHVSQEGHVFTDEDLDYFRLMAQVANEQ